MGVEDFTICIGTYGGNEWVQLAAKRAIPSAEAQGCQVIHRHAKTLARARNDALALAGTALVVFLDADDELAPGYIEALAGGSADLRAPSISYLRPHLRRRPHVPKVAGHRHECSAGCLAEGNFLVIGTAVLTELAREVGGFKEWPVFEDWCFFQRCWLAGGTVEVIPEAVYLAHVRPDSRNRAPGAALKNSVHREIVDANRPLSGIAA